MIKTALPLFKGAYKYLDNLNMFKQKNIYQLGGVSQSLLNIIFIVPAVKGYKAGGDKVIYKQSEVINSMKNSGITSQILHPDNHNFKHDWFDNNVILKLSNRLSASSDFVIIPEVMVIPHAKMLKDLGVRYGIYVQNGYSASIPLYVGNIQDLEDAYKYAEVILTISGDTSDCIALAFPNMISKIHRIFYSVDANKFKASANKENLITYMPRKLARHSDLVKFFLERNLPSDWRLAPINGLNEDGVVDLLSRSKIFLSFSEFEGCPLPPVEAALTGNYVIGYSGEGAREYWIEPSFTLINCGDVKEFTKQILNRIKKLDANTYQDDKAFQDIKMCLAEKYSAESEQKSLKQFVERILK